MQVLLMEGVVIDSAAAVVGRRVVVMQILGAEVAVAIVSLARRGGC